jgi:hypothetical protein
MAETTIRFSDGGSLIDKAARRGRQTLIIEEMPDSGVGIRDTNDGHLNVFREIAEHFTAVFVDLLG